jgi:hypothetical protein
MIEEVFKTVCWGILIFVIVTVIWLSPVGKFIDGFIDEFEEFRKWKREREK